jgi:SAM-dependent methyltransferase
VTAGPFQAPPGQEASLDRMADAGNYNDWMVERALPLLGARVLDFGAGIGTFTETLAAHADVVAVEPDPEFVPRLRARLGGNERVTIVAADTSWLADGDPRTTFDTVVCLNVLEHIADQSAVLRGFHGRLDPRGHLLLLVPAHQALYGAIDRSVGHERRYSRADLRTLLEASGFEPVELRYVNPVGAFGWLVSSRVLGREQVPASPLKAYDALVPLIRQLDRVALPFGLSLWAVARRR